MSEDRESQAADATSALPGYQPTERIDLAELAKVIATEETDPALAIHEPLGRATGMRPAPPEIFEIDDDDEGAPAEFEVAPEEPEEPEPDEQEPEPERPRAQPPAVPPTPPSPIEKETQEILRRLPRPQPLEAPPERKVTIYDLPIYRLRRPGDLVASVVAVLGVVLVLLLAVFAHNTTQAMGEDVVEVLPQALRALLTAPIWVLEGLTTMWLPIAIGITAFVGRRSRQVLEAVAAGVAAGATVWAGNWVLALFPENALVSGVTTASGVAFIPTIGALAGYLTVMGTADRRRLVTWTWNLLWVTLVLQVLRNGMTLPGALASVLVGRAAGMAVRYLAGVVGDRAYGAALVVALRRCGIDPERVLRIVDGRPVEGVEPVEVMSDAPIGYVLEDPAGLEAQIDDDDETPTPTPAAASAPAAAPATPDPSAAAARTRALQQTWDFSAELRPITEPIAGIEPTEGPREPRERPRPPVRAATAVVGEDQGENRIYSVRDVDGRVWDVGVLDGDRQVISTLAAIWNTIRLRGPAHRRPATLRAAMDHAALLVYAVEAAGVRSPRLRGLTLEEDSAVLVSEHFAGAQVIADVPTSRLTDDVLDAMWHQLATAHQSGVAHRNLDDQAVLLDSGGTVYLTGWAQGEVSSARLARRLDLVALLALQALRVGPERAMASAVRNLTTEDLQAIAPIFQTVALPERTRVEARKNKKVLKEVQNVLLGILPSGAEVEPVQMRRFSGRTIITVTIAVVAAIVVLTGFNFQEMLTSIRGANPVYLIIAFALGLLTYVGSAMALVAFSPEKLSLWRTTLVQVAASVVALVAPAGVGPAALNLRFLQKNKLDTPMAVATVALVQVSQFLTTVLLLVSLALVTGSSGALDSLPSGAVLIAVAAIIVVIGAALFIPTVRRWVLAKIMPTIRQIWPRLVWVVGQPGRLVAALAGNVIQTVGYIAAFGFALHAFGASLSITSLSIVYLAGNTAGAMVPTPGGIGAVEIALASGLTAAGVAGAVAWSTSFAFRLVTFWVRIPLGWVALQYLQKRNLV